jgi:hypothetical protein
MTRTRSHRPCAAGAGASAGELLSSVRTSSVPCGEEQSRSAVLTMRKVSTALAQE